MGLNLSRYINKTIFVSIRMGPDDGKCAPYKLRGVELVGLWLDSPDLTKSFIPEDYKTDASISWQFFVPFSQIACVAIPTATAGAATTTVATALAPGQKTKKEPAQKEQKTGNK
jgi:hypothetical protein